MMKIRIKAWLLPVIFFARVSPALCGVRFVPHIPEGHPLYGLNALTPAQRSDVFQISASGYGEHDRVRNQRPLILIYKTIF